MCTNHVHSHFAGENNYIAKLRGSLGNVVSIRAKTQHGGYLIYLLNSGFWVLLIGIQSRKKQKQMGSSWGQEGFRETEKSKTS